MAAFMEGATMDLDGDGKLKKDDQWSLVYDDVAGFGFYIGAGQTITEFDDDGLPYLDFDSESSIKVIDYLVSRIGSRENSLRGEDYAKNTETIVFSEGRALFAGQTYCWIPMKYRDMEDDYGVLPMPLLDETQGEYYSYSQPWVACGVCVPVTNTKIDKTGIIIESMAYLSDDFILSAAYETTYKNKFSRDSESAQVLDIVADAATYDLDVIFNWGASANELRDAVLGKSKNYVSKFAKIKDKAASDIAALIETISGN